MSTSKLAFPEWVMGQVLLPEQFEAQQQAMLAHLQLATKLAGLPAYGLVRLVIDETLLALGSLRVEALTYVFPSGLLIAIPGNAVIINNIDLVACSGDNPAVFLHVEDGVVSAKELKGYLDDPASLRRVIYRVELSFAAHRDDARESIKLMELVRDRDQRWGMGGYAPPLLHVGGVASPFLRSTLECTLRVIESIVARLNGRIGDPFLGSEQGVELRRVRASAQRALALLADYGIGGAEHEQPISCHPYVLYAVLRDFCIDATQQEQHREPPLPLRYRHEAPVACFEALLRRIETSLGRGSLSKNRLEFEHREDWFVATPFPASLRAAKDVFLIVKSDSEQRVRLEGEGIKLASLQRIEAVYTKALAGVILVPYDERAFRHVYGQNASVYRVQSECNDEWAQALKNGDLCFPAWRDLMGIKAVLVWGE